MFSRIDTPDVVAERQAGALLVEVMIAVTVLAVGFLGFFGTFTVNLKGGQDLRDLDEARVSFQEVVEHLRSMPFETVYSEYNERSFDVLSLRDASGAPASISVTCFTDETAIPREFGPVLDLDGDGSLSTTDTSGTYKLLPVRLTLVLPTTSGIPQTRSLFLLLRGEENPNGPWSLAAIISRLKELAGTAKNATVSDSARAAILYIQSAIGDLSKVPLDHQGGVFQLKSALAEIQTLLKAGFLDAGQGQRIAASLAEHIERLSG